MKTTGSYEMLSTTWTTKRRRNSENHNSNRLRSWAKKVSAVKNKTQFTGDPWISKYSIKLLHTFRDKVFFGCSQYSMHHLLQLRSLAKRRPSKHFRGLWKNDSPMEQGQSCMMGILGRTSESSSVGTSIVMKQHCPAPCDSYIPWLLWTADFSLLQSTGKCTVYRHTPFLITLKDWFLKSPQTYEHHFIFRSLQFLLFWTVMPAVSTPYYGVSSPAHSNGFTTQKRVTFLITPAQKVVTDSRVTTPMLSRELFRNKFYGSEVCRD
jgi:hypothetical protein